jgi:CHASE2 domain-containing sensor protein
MTALLQAGLWLGVLAVDPFGMSSAADRVSEGIFLRLYPILYPAEWRDRIQIVMIDEKQLPLTNEIGASGEWPLRFEEHAALIERILALEPKAVFVDFLFDTEKGRDPKVFEDFIAALPPDGAPVVFAAYGNTNKRLVEPLQSLPFAGARALRGLVELTAPQNHYQLDNGKGGLAAAAVLYNATAGGGDRVNGSHASDMLVAWGNTVPESDAALSECAPVTADPESRWRAFGTAIVSGLAGVVGGPEAARGPKSWERLQPCAYHGEIGARELFAGGDRLKRIKGSYVFVGGAIAGTGDTVTSPVHGQLPGVFLHAMALDNLLSFKGAPLTPGGWAAIPQVLLIFLAAFAGGATIADWPAPRTRLEAIGTLALRFAVWVVFAAVAAVLLLMFLIEFELAPYNWGSVLAIAGVVFFAGAGKALVTLVKGGD